MSKEITVVLGGRNYTVAALPIAQAKVWREALAIPFGTLASVLTSANTVELNQLDDIAILVTKFSGVLLGSVDLMLGLLFSYSEALRKDREWIEKNAYDEEALVAFGEVLKLAFPFGVLLEAVTGRMGNKTLPNLPLRSGASGLSASGPTKKPKPGSEVSKTS